jgi:quercetin dioxygenase-like cupin family protein
LKAGDTYYEQPGDRHVVSRNASKTDTAKFLVVFVKEKAAALLVPDSTPTH